MSDKKDPLLAGDTAIVPAGEVVAPPANKGLGAACIAITIATCLLYIYLFSRVFMMGAPIYMWLSNYEILSPILATSAILLFFIMYLCDISYWPGTGGMVARRGGLALCVLLYLASGVFDAKNSAYAPLTSFLIYLQLQTLALQGLFGNADKSSVLSIFSVGYILSGVVAMTLWLLWLMGYFGLTKHGDGINNQWSMDNRAAWSDELGCTEDWRTGSICLPAFMLWSSPLILAGVYFIFGFLMAILAKSLKGNHGESTAQMMFGGIAVAMCGMWVAASLSPAGARLTNLVTSVCFFVIVAIILLGISSVGSSQFTGAVGGTPAAAKVYAAMHGDFFHAFLFFFIGPLFILYFPISFLNQVIRKVGTNMSGGPIKLKKAVEKPKRFSIVSLFSAKDEAVAELDEEIAEGTAPKKRSMFKPLSEDEMKLPMTKAAHNVLDALEMWQWSTVLINDMWIAIIIWGVKYGGTLTNMCMAMLLEAMQGTPCWIVSIVITIIGIIMFLIPVVPSGAVYLTAGCLLVPMCGKDAAGTYANFWNAVILAVLLCYAMKVISHMIQQQVFGVGLGKKVSVRATVGVNSPMVKCIRFILSKPGFAPAKIAILCGGPDWPTSVLCGILGLNILQTTMGLLPVVFLVAPVAMAASFQVRIDDGPDWAMAASMMLLVCTALQIMMMCVAMYFISQTKKDAAEEIAKYEDDKEVADLEEKQAAEKLLFNEATEIAKMPALVFATLVVGIMGYNVSAYMLLARPSDCFEPFALTEDLDDVMCVECPRAAVKNPGGFAIGLLIVGIVCMNSFQKWAKNEVKKKMPETPPS